ncbi:MAG TPA: hypothetical protein VFN48_10085 [Solirubrobacteraceae bacterium]|nr:hypothetical protein [Solirubrobacteraceae bacterium]
MSRTPQELAAALLEAQVQALQAELGPDAFGALVETEVDHLLAAAAQLRLAEVVSVEQIQAVAVKYAAFMVLPGSIPEIASEIAERIYDHPAQAANRLADVIPLRHVEELTQKLLELPLARERLFASPMVTELLAEWLARMAVSIAGDVGEVSGRIPGVASLLGLGGQLVQRAAPEAPVALQARLRELTEATTRALLRRARAAADAPEEPWVAEAVVELWREQSAKPIGAFRELFTQEDLEELLVLLYDLWLSLRTTPYLRALIEEGVDLFFAKYAEATLAELLEEFGVSRADLLEEVYRFAPPILARLRETGMLAAFLRRRLAPFYAAPETLALLAERDRGAQAGAPTSTAPRKTSPR